MGIAESRLKWRWAAMACWALACASSCKQTQPPELTVIVVSAVEGLPLEGTVPVVAEPGRLAGQASTSTPARLRQVKAGQQLNVRVGANYRAKPVSVTLGADGRATAELRVLRVEPGHPNARACPMVGDEKWLEVDLTLPWRVMSWRSGDIVLSREPIPSSPGAMAKEFANSWKIHGNHQDALDQKRDTARVLVTRETDVDSIMAITTAMTSFRREMANGDARVSKPAIVVTIQQAAPLTARQLAKLKLESEPLGAPPGDELRVASAGAAASNAFGLRLYGTVATRPGNVVTSPVGATVSAAMLLAATAGATAEQVESALGGATQPSGLRREVDSLLTALRRRRGLNVVSGVWVDKDVTVREGFGTAVERELEGKLVKTSLREAERAAQSVDEHVAEQTWDNVPHVVPKFGWETDARMVVVSAAHFARSWHTGFKAGETAEADFRVSATSTVRVPFMHMRERLTVRRGAGYTAVDVPYADKHQGMRLILPDKGRLASLEKRFGQVIEELEQSAKRRSALVALSLPRFHIGRSSSLVPSLRAVGVTDAFDPEKGNYGAMTGGETFVRTDVMHAVSIGAYEGGTHRDFYSHRGFGRRRFEKTEYEEVVFDRPFLFVVYDDELKAILFMGRVSNPALGAEDPR